MVPEGSRPRQVALFSIVLLIAVVVGAVSFNDRPAEADERTVTSPAPADHTFHTVPKGHANVYLWGINNGTVPFPYRVRPATTHEAAVDRFLADAPGAMVDAYWHQLPRLAGERSDAYILPFQVNVPEHQFFGIWVRNNSSIEEPEDLNGKTIGIRNNFSRDVYMARPTFILLNALYDVNVTLTNQRVGNGSNTGVFAPYKRLSHPAVDAVWMAGDTRLADNHTLKPVFLPFQELEKRFGDTALPTFLAVNDRSAVDSGLRAVESLQESSRRAQTSRTLFMHTFTICNEFLVNTSRPQIEPFTPQTIDSLQFFLDAAHEQGHIDRRINLSTLIVRQEEWVLPARP